MSFINNLVQQERSRVKPVTPAVIAPPVMPEGQQAGLAATFRAPSRFNSPLNRQFQAPQQGLPRNLLTR